MFQFCIWSSLEFLDAPLFLFFRIKNWFGQVCVVVFLLWLNLELNKLMADVWAQKKSYDVIFTTSWGDFLFIDMDWLDAFNQQIIICSSSSLKQTQKRVTRKSSAETEQVLVWISLGKTTFRTANRTFNCIRRLKQKKFPKAEQESETDIWGLLPLWLLCRNCTYVHAHLLLTSDRSGVGGRSHVERWRFHTPGLFPVMYVLWV